LKFGRSLAYLLGIILISVFDGFMSEIFIFAKVLLK
jgi:hypothetical protein